MKKYMLLLTCFTLLLPLLLATQQTLAAQPVVPITAKPEKRRRETPQALISGLVWHDVNHDGQVDEGEPGLAGVKVELWEPPSSVPSASCTFTLTNSSGHYDFNNENAPNCTSVQVYPPAEYPVITNQSDRDYGLYEGIKSWLPFIDKAQISGLVWHDKNHNGQVDGEEPGLGSVKVELWGTLPHRRFAFCTSTFTDSSGHYTFANSDEPWCETVQILPPAAYPVITNQSNRDYGLYEGLKSWLPFIRHEIVTVAYH